MKTTPGFTSRDPHSSMGGGVTVCTAPWAYENRACGFWTTRVAVVFDVLRATSTQAAILAHPGNRIRPCATVEEAREWKQRDPDWLLAGERDGVAPQGFARGNSPREWSEGPMETTVLQTTTNGTRALLACAGALEVFTAALINAAAVARSLPQWCGDKPLVLILAGTGEDFALEDAVGAARLLTLLDADHPWRALAPEDQAHARWMLGYSRNGRRLRDLGLEADIDWCARWDVLDVVPRMRDGFLQNDRMEDPAGTA